MHAFAHSLEHLLAELERVDLLIRAHVAAFRAAQTEDEQFRGLYVSEQQVDALLAAPRPARGACVARATHGGPQAARSRCGHRPAARTAGAAFRAE